MSAHTPEPWDFDESSGDIYFNDGGAVCPVVATVCNDNTSDEQFIANATRIVACINACAGIPTAELEQIARLNDTLERLRAMRLAIVNMLGPQ